jgi:hypothetical protein
MALIFLLWLGGLGKLNVVPSSSGTRYIAMYKEKNVDLLPKCKCCRLRDFLYGWSDVPVPE